MDGLARRARAARDGGARVRLRTARFPQPPSPGQPPRAQRGLHRDPRPGRSERPDQHRHVHLHLRGGVECGHYAGGMHLCGSCVPRPARISVHRAMAAANGRHLCGPGLSAGRFRRHAGRFAKVLHPQLDQHCFEPLPCSADRVLSEPRRGTANRRSDYGWLAFAGVVCSRRGGPAFPAGHVRLEVR